MRSHESEKGLGGVREGSFWELGHLGASGGSRSIEVTPFSNGMRALPENSDFTQVFEGRCQQVRFSQYKMLPGSANAPIS